MALKAKKRQKPAAKADSFTLLKLRLGVTDRAQNALLAALLSDAEAWILGYTRRKPCQWLPCFDGAAREIAAVNYGRMGLEGAASRTEGSVSTAFIADGAYPASVTRQLDPHRLIKGAFL